jgi:hypothetical protein
MKKNPKKPMEPHFDEFPSYKGGHTLLVYGYIFEFSPGHHLQNGWGWVGQHRLVAEDKIGRDLVRGEVVHHEDGNSTNNHPDNLTVMLRHDHQKYHMRKLAIAQRAKITAEQVAESLAIRGIQETATFLHVHSMTLRRQFPELVKPYQRRSPTRIDDQKYVDLVRQYALDESVGTRELTKKTGMSAMTISRICKRYGIHWKQKTRRGEKHKTYRGRPSLHTSDTDDCVTEFEKRDQLSSALPDSGVELSE